MKKHFPWIILACFTGLSLLLYFNIWGTNPQLPAEVIEKTNKSIAFDNSIELHVQKVEIVNEIVSIDIWILNMTKRAIWFPDDYGIKVFKLNDSGHWEPIENRNNYHLPEPGLGILVDPYQSMLDASFANLTILRADYISSTQVKVLVTGSPTWFGYVSKKQLGAFVDIDPNETSK